MTSLCAQAMWSERPHLHRTHLETFSDVGRGTEIGWKWKRELLSGDPCVVYTCCPCIRLALVSKTLCDSNLSWLWVEIYPLSRRGDEARPRGRSMSHSHPHSHIQTQSHMLVNCAHAEVCSEATPQPRGCRGEGVRWRHFPFSSSEWRRG